MLQLDSSVDTAVLIDSFIQKKRRELTLNELIEELKGILSNSWKKATREAAIQIIEMLNDIEGSLSQEELDLIELRAGKVLGSPLEELKKKQIIDIEKALYVLGMKGGLKNTGVKFAWNLADQKSLEVLDEALMFWIGSYYDDNISEGFKATLQDFFEGGYNRKDFADLLKVHFKELGDKTDSYWNLLADHTATKTREIGRVSGYEAGGVEKVKIKSHIDDRTTKVCRSLNGKVVEVYRMRAQVENYFKACKTKDKEKIKESWPWVTDEFAEKKLSSDRGINRQIKNGNIGLPPYHGRCRTITVAVFD